jgi:hypothetical protein
MNKFTSQRSSKFTRTTIKDGLSLAIFATNGMYIEKARFARLSMLIQHVFTFCKILFPFTFIKSTSFKNSNYFFELWEKYEYNDWNKTSMHFTTRIWNTVWITKLMWCAMQWMPSKWGTYLSCIWCVTSFLTS